MATHEREIVRPVALADAHGRLRDEAVGFARRPLFDARIAGRCGRAKRWDYWCVIFPAGALQVTVADLGYLGLVEVSFVDLETGAIASAPVVAPLGFGVRLPDGVEVAPIRFRSPRVGLSIEPSLEGTRIAATAWTPRGRIEANVTVEPGGDSLDVVVPWDRDRFQLTSKHVARPARGTIRALGRRHDLAVTGAFGCLDYGRGVWPRDVIWNWGTAAAHVAGVGRVGVQLGGKWTDGTGATENGIFVDGRLDKIGAELRWEYDRGDFRRPWRAFDDRGDVALTFSPRVVRRSRIELGIGRSVLHLAFGSWSGIVRAHGREIALRDALGWAEEHVARW